METVILKPGRESFFESQGFRTFEDFFEYAQGETINRNTKRSVTIMKLVDDGRQKTFFMKRFFKPHFKDMLFTVRSFGKLCSQAELEWRNANMLLDNGIETYHPVCYGYRSICGIERQSFFITEEINGVCLLDYLQQSWNRLEGDERRKLVINLAAFFRKIHHARLSLPDAYIWHVYRVANSTSPEGYQLAMIDLHRMQIRTRGHQQAAMNLGRFLYSLPEGFMDKALETLFMESYLAGFKGNRQRFTNSVKHWHAKISARRGKPPVSTLA